MTSCRVLASRGHVKKAFKFNYNLTNIYHFDFGERKKAFYNAVFRLRRRLGFVTAIERREKTTDGMDEGLATFRQRSQHKAIRSGRTGRAF